MRKTRDLLKKLIEISAKMGTIKDRNCMDQTEAEDIKKRCKNTHQLCTKKIFMTPINTVL